MVLDKIYCSTMQSSMKQKICDRLRLPRGNVLVDPGIRASSIGKRNLSALSMRSKNSSVSDQARSVNLGAKNATEESLFCKAVFSIRKIIPGIFSEILSISLSITALPFSSNKSLPVSFRSTSERKGSCREKSWSDSRKRLACLSSWRLRDDWKMA